MTRRDEVVEKGRQEAARRLEAAAADHEYRDGEFRIAGTDRRIGLFDVGNLESTKTHAPPDYTYPNGCHICEVEIDPDTGHVDIAGWAAVDDFGTVINPMIVEGQVHGGLAQGIGQALYESCVFDKDSGQILTC